MLPRGLEALIKDTGPDEPGPGAQEVDLSLEESPRREWQGRLESAGQG